MLPPSPDQQQGPQLPNDQGRAFGHSVTPARLFRKGVISEPLGNKMVFELRSRPGSTEPGLTSEADGRSSGAGREEGGDGRERMLRRVGGLLKKARRWPCCARILILPNSCNFVPLNQPRCPLRFPLPVGSHLGLTASEYGWWALGRTMGRPRPPSQDKPLARAPSLLSFHACTTLNARPPCHRQSVGRPTSVGPFLHHYRHRRHRSSRSPGPPMTLNTRKSRDHPSARCTCPRRWLTGLVPSSTRCPICLENENVFGKFGMCCACGQLYCGDCNTPEEMGMVKDCPTCHAPFDVSDEVNFQRLRLVHALTTRSCMQRPNGCRPRTPGHTTSSSGTLAPT